MIFSQQAYSGSIHNIIQNAVTADFFNHGQDYITIILDIMSHIDDQCLISYRFMDAQKPTKIIEKYIRHHLIRSFQDARLR